MHVKKTLVISFITTILSYNAVAADRKYTVIEPPFKETDFYPSTNRITVPSKCKNPTSWVSIDLNHLPAFRKESDIFDVKQGTRLALNRCVLLYMGVEKSDLTTDFTESKLIDSLDLIDLKTCSASERMFLLQTLVKSGSIKAVKKLTTVLQADYKGELENYCPLMRTLGEKIDRPIFWLAAIVTRWDTTRVPDSNYSEIEAYLCDILCPTNEAFVNGRMITRDQYVANVNEWKKNENSRLEKTRYKVTS